MPDYSFPSWLTPKSEPWQALVAGAQVGANIAANRARNQALYAHVQQQQQEQDLQERQFAARNEANTLANEVVRLKISNDAADFQQLRAWWPKFNESTGGSPIELPTLRSPDQMQKIAAMVAEKRKVAGTAEIAQKMSGFKDMTDSAIPETIYGVLAKNPSWAPLAERFLDDHRQALQFKQKQEEIAELRLSREQDKKTAPMLNLQDANRLDAEALALEATDPTKAAALRRDATLLRSTITAPSESIETYTDANGVQQVRVVKGPAPGAGPKDLAFPTVATTSQIQQRMLATDKTIELGAKLMGSLTDADVGVRGNVNQIVINEGLAQLMPGLQKGQVTEARTMLGQFNENAMKAIASDPRISDRDQARYKKMLPALGAVESVSSAKDKIKSFMDQFREQSRKDAVAAKLPIPDWALSVSELKAKVANKELTEDEAVKILVRYH